MHSPIKDISQALRDSLKSELGIKLGACHGYEIVAAYFGFQSHMALLAYDGEPIREASYGDEAMIEMRLGKLKGLPEGLPSARALTETVELILKRG